MASTSTSYHQGKPRDIESLTPKESVARKQPKQSSDCFLGFCRLINAVTGISAILCLVAHGMALAVGGSLTEEGFLRQFLRLYGIMFSLLLALVETEWQLILAWGKILESWLARGLMQAFVAVLTLEIATSTGQSDFDKSIRVYRTAAGSCLLGCAGFYMLGGLLCFGSIRESRHRREVERVKLESNLVAMERQAEEMRSLLASYNKE